LLGGRHPWDLLSPMLPGVDSRNHTRREPARRARTTMIARTKVEGKALRE
jgi:hypothetical protein